MVVSLLRLLFVRCVYANIVKDPKTDIHVPRFEFSLC